MPSPLDLLRRLTAEKVDFILVGGMAAVAHGSAAVTEDVDVCIRFDRASLRGVFNAVGSLNPRQRMHPARPPLGPSPDPFVGTENLHLLTDLGIVDFLGEIMAVGGFTEVAARAIELDLGGFACRVIGLDDLIACKQALGRPKDRQVATELELVRQRLQRSPK